jgi:nicotinamidase-related amidase
MEHLASTVRRDDLVVLVIDIQERLAAAMDRREEVAAASAKLIRAASGLGAPTLVTRQYPKGLGDVEPVIASATDAALRAGARVDAIDKTAFSCMTQVGFRELLEATGRRTVAITGMETHICVTQTALALHEAGYAVHVCADAVCSRRALDNDVALDRLRAAGVVVTTTESVIYEALGAAGTDDFKAVLALIKDA